MTYPTVTDRKVVPIHVPMSRHSHRGVQATVWLDADRPITVTVPKVLLSLTDENEADLFIEIAREKDNTYGQVAA